MDSVALKEIELVINKLRLSAISESAGLWTANVGDVDKDTCVLVLSSKRYAGE